MKDPFWVRVAPAASCASAPLPRQSDSVGRLASSRRSALALNSPYTSNPDISFDPWASGRIANFHSFASVRDFFEMLQRNSCNSIIRISPFV